ncbi:MAG: hypothetical protein WBO53_03235 [Thermoanaerobaculia bacterium]
MSSDDSGPVPGRSHLLQTPKGPVIVVLLLPGLGDATLVNGQVIPFSSKTATSTATTAAKKAAKWKRERAGKSGIATMHATIKAHMRV